MTASLRALLAGVIDYAGMYPPATLSLADAVENYRRYRQSSDAGMLGRFVCPANRLTELAAVGWSAADGRLAVIAAAEPFLGIFPLAEWIEAVEYRYPAELVRSADREGLACYVREATAAAPATASLYFEFAPGESALSESNWLASLDAAICSLRNRGSSAGLKIRAPTIPAGRSLATVIDACHNARVFWKATAGLHHPLPDASPTHDEARHGFLNVLTAAVLADAHGLSLDDVTIILSDTNAAHFRFTDDALAWGDWTLSTDRIAAARQRSLRSFGSCSFDEPRDELRSLGLLP